MLKFQDTAIFMALVFLTLSPKAVIAVNEDSVLFTYFKYSGTSAEQNTPGERWDHPDSDLKTALELQHKSDSDYATLLGQLDGQIPSPGNIGYEEWLRAHTKRAAKREYVDDTIKEQSQADPRKYFWQIRQKDGEKDPKDFRWFSEDEFRNSKGMSRNLFDSYPEKWESHLSKDEQSLEADKKE